MAQSIILPADARFTCQSCGRCCQGWSVPVDQATVDKLRAHDWGAEPFERMPGDGDPYRTRLVGGRCFFLDSENRCRIHTELSYDAKPAVCRSFPLTVLEVAGKRYARMSFWCPTVAANTGKPLEHQARWIKETARQMDHRDAPLMINERTEMSPRDFERVHQAVRRFLVDRSLPIGDRLAAAAALVQRLDEAAGGSVPVEEVVAVAESAGAVSLSEETKRRGNASGGRRALSLYLLQDRQPGRLAVLTRFFSVLLFNAGLGQLESRAVPSRAGWRHVQRVRFTASGQPEQLLTRYLTAKLDSRRYVAGELTLVSGFNLLAAGYGVINVLARMRAASNDRASCDGEDVQFAVSAADLLVVEHPGTNQGQLRRRLMRLALGSSGLCGDLLTYLRQNPSRTR